MIFRIIRQGSSEKIQNDILMSGGLLDQVRGAGRGSSDRMGSPRSQSFFFARSQSIGFPRSLSTIFCTKLVKNVFCTKPVNERETFFARWLSIVFLAQGGAKKERM